MMNVSNKLSVQVKQQHKCKQCKEIEIKRQAIGNTKNLCWGLRHRSMSPPLPPWRISLSTIGSSIKGPYNKELQWST